MSFLLQMTVLKLTHLRGNCIVCELLMNWIQWMAEVICFFFHIPHIPLLLNFDFLDEPFNNVVCPFIATTSNTTLEEKKNPE